MAQQSVKQPNKNSKSNTVRSFIFFFCAFLLCSAFLSSLLSSSNNLEEVPLSDVISRANDENGDIKKIVVKGNNLEITLRDKDFPTQTSRKDGSGTLYDQGLINKCADYSGEALTSCQAKYPTVEYVDDIDVLGIVLDVLLIGIPIVIVIFFIRTRIAAMFRPK